MALPMIPGVVRASVRGLAISGRQWTNVWHLRYAGGASYPGVTEITAADAKFVRMYLGTVYSGGVAWMSACPTNVTLVDITYYVLNGTATPIVINHAGAGTIATSANNASEVAHVLTLRTPTRGRRYRGRIYLPTAGNTQWTGGGLTPSVATSVLAQLNGLVADLATIQWEIGVASYGVSWNRGPNNAHGAATKVTWTPFFTSIVPAAGPPSLATMDLKPDVQRRRK